MTIEDPSVGNRLKAPPSAPTHRIVRWLLIVNILLGLFLPTPLSVFAGAGDNAETGIPLQPAVTEEAQAADKRLAETLTCRFRQEFAQAINTAKFHAKKYVRPRVFRNPYAVVLDLDETLLDNRSYFIIHKKYDPALWEVWVREAQAPAIPETLDFVRWLDEHRFHIYFVSGRKESARKLTEENLRRIGVRRFDALYLKPDTFNGSSAADFKTEARKAIEAKGQKIILTLGDQESDLRGGHGQGFKLPNPIYTIP